MCTSSVPSVNSHLIWRDITCGRTVLVSLACALQVYPVWTVISFEGILLVVGLYLCHWHVHFKCTQCEQSSHLRDISYGDDCSYVWVPNEESGILLMARTVLVSVNSHLIRDILWGLYSCVWVPMNSRGLHYVYPCQRFSTGNTLEDYNP
jgi:hypothetical protein